LPDLQQLLRQELAAVDEHIRQLQERKNHLTALLSANVLPDDIRQGPSVRNRLQTSDMVNAVLKHADVELNAGQIADAIRKEFGTNAPKTLYQMLYRSARAKRGLYKTSSGQFGLLEWKASRSKD